MRCRRSGNSHKRCMVLEVMGHFHAGWIALHSGIAGGARDPHPGEPRGLDQICAWVASVKSRGRSPMVVVAEGSSRR